MTLPVVSILVYFGAEFSGGASFVLDDTTKGVIDNTDYLIAGDDGDGVEIATSGYSINVQRGRSRELDDFQVGQCTVNLRNFDRLFDALNSAGVYYGDIVPGKRVVIKVWEQVIFTGTIEDWDMDWQVDGTATASFRAEDALGALARTEFDAWTTTAGQLTGARITDVLNRPEVGFGSNRDIGTGASILQGDNVTWGSNALNYLQLVARSDSGRLYASRDNLVTFKDRHALIDATSSITFRDDIFTVADSDGLEIDTGEGDVWGVSGVPFAGITTQVGSELLYNRVGVDREGGTLQTAQDTASRDAYGVRSLSITGLLLSTDSESESMAEYLCAIYRDPKPRIDSVMVKVQACEASDRAALAAVEIGQLVRVLWTPQGIDPAIDQTVVVEGVSHDVSLDQHITTLSLAPPTQSGVFILDDAVLGVLDTGPGVLSY